MRYSKKKHLMQKTSTREKLLRGRIHMYDTESNIFSEQIVQVLTFSNETNSTHLYQLHILRFSEKEVKQMLDTSSISGLSSLPAVLGSVCFALHALHFKPSTEVPKRFIMSLLYIMSFVRYSILKCKDVY